MMVRYLLVGAVFLFGCGEDASEDAGPNPGMDAAGIDGDVARIDAGPDARVPPGTDGGCIPTVEICGDRMDQNCDGRDTSCGDSDMDGIDACRAGDDLTRCDCDDSRADVRPPFMGVPGAPELCDGVDNNCNGRVDEAAECCDGCAAVMPRTRADICTEDGTCDCSTEPGLGACAAGQTCCSSGCTDTLTDIANCGSCNSMCTAQSDRCTGGDCRCGSGPPCDKARMCGGGSC